MRDQPSAPRSGYAVPDEVPAPWRKDLSKIEAVLEALRSRHDDLEVAQLLVLAANRNLTETRRPRSALAAAMVRGVVARGNLKEEEGGSVSAEEARAFMGGITKQAVLDRYKKGRLLGWRETRQNAVRFPVWQFTPQGVLPGLEDVIAILRRSPSVNDWGLVLFFLNKREALGGERPLDVLRRGDVKAVTAAAEDYRE